jgi:glucose-1-phosphate thymidylyltransferase
MKGVILAGGTGSRLRELTKVVNKHLLPVYNKPMIYYPIETLRSAGITSIMVVTDKRKAGDFLHLLGSGKEFGVRFTFGLQDSAAGIADALEKARDFVGSENVTVILGDNILLGEVSWLDTPLSKGARIFLKEVSDPYRYGIAELAEDGSIKDIVEKPQDSISKKAVIGVYQYTNRVFNLIEDLKPSERGELEITDLNRYFLSNGDLEYKIIKNKWIDAGVLDSLLKAQLMVRDFTKKR